LYSKEIDATEVSTTADYFTNNFGMGISYGIPRSEIETIQLAMALDQTRISKTTSTPDRIKNYLDTKGSKFDEINLSASYVIDSRNRTIFATNGSKNSTSLLMSIPGSTLKYYKFNHKFEYNLAVSDSTTMVFRSNLGYGNSYSSSEALAFFKRYYAGGIYSVRGYSNSGLGPKDDDGNAQGGDLLTTATLELVIPPFGSDLTSSLRFGFFTDVGTVSTNLTSFRTDDLRYSAGASMMWLSPVGPLNFSFAEALNPGLRDLTETFQFYIGGTF
jgi:outer membrane protein insertion porin family